jgi:hypothetical protein
MSVWKHLQMLILWVRYATDSPHLKGSLLLIDYKR